MGRKRIDEIENSANAPIAMMIRRYIGDENYNVIATEIGIDPSTLSYICRGKSTPTLGVLIKLGRKPRNGVGIYELLCAMEMEDMANVIQEYEATIAEKDLEILKLKSQLWDLSQKGESK